MNMILSQLDNDIRLIKLNGKLDVTGTAQIETGFAGYCSGDAVRVIVDVSDVSFMASTGIRLLMLNARSIARRGGKMVILNPIPDVKNILEVTGIPGIIPIYSSLESAEVVVMVPQKSWRSNRGPGPVPQSQDHRLWGERRDGREGHG